jgi:hypothetical protein
MVWVIRTVRPNIVVDGWDHIKRGHGNHQAAGYLTPIAVKDAADPTKFPEQLAQGLKPWRVSMVLNPVFAYPQGKKVDFTGAWMVPFHDISPIWGQSYLQIALEGYVHHRSQGVNPNSDFFRRRYGLRRANGPGPMTSDFTQPLTSLARILPFPSEQLLAAADRDLDQARAAAEQLDWAGAARQIADAGKQIDTLEQRVKDSKDPRASEAAWELEKIRARVNHALAAAAALKIEANASRSELVAGEDFSVTAQVEHRQNLATTFSAPGLILPAGWSITKQSEKKGVVSMTVAVPAGAKTPHTSGDWMYPFPPPLVRAQTRVVMDGYSFDFTAPVDSQRTTTTATSLLDYPLRLVPALSLTVDPEQFVVTEGHQPKQFELFARIHSFSEKPSVDRVGVEVPSGWTVPPEQEVKFSGTGNQMVHMIVTPPANIPAGNYELKAYVKRGEQTFRTSLEPLPSLPTRLWSSPATVPVHAFSINVPNDLHVGYIDAGNDDIPESLVRLGVDVKMLDAKTLAFGDLSKFDAIVVGLRAYELRPDAAASNSRLLRYAADGGTLVVQYELGRVWDKLKLAPYPATIGNSPRITDENAAVKFINPSSPLLNFPNKINEADFNGWVQERGLDFWEKWDSHYHAVLAMHDPGEKDLDGGLVWTRTGRGYYIYTGLSFSRQLPRGNPGAFRLFVNLLSQSRHNPN